MKDRPFVSDLDTRIISSVLRRSSGVDDVLRKMSVEEPELGALLDGGYGAMDEELEQAGVDPEVRLKVVRRLRLGVARLYSAWQIARFLKWRATWGGPPSPSEEGEKKG